MMAERDADTDRLVSRNLASLAYEHLERAIIEGELQPGTRLSESALARRFGISRGPLREALGQLEGRKLVTRETNLGARVVPLSLEDLMELMDIRESLEGMACRLAASRISKTDLNRLARLLEEHAKSVGVREGRSYFQGTGDQDFHQFILQSARNARLSGLLGQDLYTLLRLYRRKLSTKPGRAAQALEEHHTIVEALASRDPDAAEEAMRAHIRAGRVAARAWLDDTPNAFGAEVPTS